ncbi:MAG: TAXI family TRAP transporter solute-binding subunit [Luteitalea sp.]|nr:TAXI family TRAP transporter solute-binding subunit [Luteitalea sp.]
MTYSVHRGLAGVWLPSDPRRRLLARAAAAVCLAATVASCEQRPTLPPLPQALTLWSGIAPAFTRDLIGRFNQAIPGIQIRLQTTPGGVVVVSALDRGEGDLGLTQSDALYLAYRRGIEGNRYPHRNLRGIAVLWFSQYYVVVRRDSPATRVEDLRGKRVGVIPRGTSGEFSMRILLGAHNMDYTDVEPWFHSTNALMPLLARGEIDAALVVYPGVPPALIATNKTTPLRLIPVTRSVTNRLRSEYPFLRPVVIAPDQLAGQVGEVETVGADWLLVCRSQLSESLVYDLTRQLFEDLPALAEKYYEARAIDPYQAAAAPIPLHPGAARYYREREILR